MFGAKSFALVVCVLGCAQAFSPSGPQLFSSSAPLLRSAACKAASPQVLSLKRSSTKALSPLRMSETEEKPVQPAEGDKSFEELEKEYLATTYRANQQDGVIIASLGVAILLIPLIAIGVAIGTGYIPLDYVR